jgi:hypothetical protein
MREQLEKTILELTRPINGQYPRPWMTEMADPENARVFIVGFNQATGFPVNSVKSHADYIDALFNRKNRSCRALYDKMRGSKGASPTRKNTDALNKMLSDNGVKDIIETNVVCYSTPMSSYLSHAQNKGGKEAGREIFIELLRLIRPKVLIVHGEGTRKELARVLGIKTPALPESADSAPCSTRETTSILGDSYAPVIFFVPSLAPPKWNGWAAWAPKHLKAVAAEASKVLGS